MSSYGTMIDSDLLPEKTAIYDLFTAYFSNPILTKTKNEDGGPIYAAKMNLLMRDYRYLIIVAPEDQQPIGSTFRLDQIKWVYLQTRTFEYEMNCADFSYISSGRPPFDSRLRLVEKKGNMATYESKDYPNLSMCLLAKKGNEFTSYPELGTIAGALETFRTIFQITI